MTANLQISQTVQTLTQHGPFLKSTVYKSSLGILEYVKRKHQNSNDLSILLLLDIMHKYHHKWMSDKNNITKCNEFKEAKNLDQFHLWKMKITKGRTSLSNPVLNFFVHFGITGYNGAKIDKRRNNFQNFSLNINSWWMIR